MELYYQTRYIPPPPGMSQFFPCLLSLVIESCSFQSFPIIVALETSPVPGISNRASALHAVLQGKYSSLLNTRYTISARKSFNYQKISAGVVQGMLLSTFQLPECIGFRMQSTPIALFQW